MFGENILLLLRNLAGFKCSIKFPDHTETLKDYVEEL